MDDSRLSYFTCYGQLWLTHSLYNILFFFLLFIVLTLLRRRRCCCCWFFFTQFAVQRFQQVFNAIKAITTTDDFVANAVNMLVIRVLFCLLLKCIARVFFRSQPVPVVIFCEYVLSRTKFYFYFHFYGYALFILLGMCVTLRFLS